MSDPSAVLKRRADEIAGGRFLSVDEMGEFAYIVYGLRFLGQSVDHYLDAFKVAAQTNVRVWVGLTFDLPRRDPDAIALFYKLYVGRGDEFAEKIRGISDDIIGLQLPDGRILMGDHVALTRLLVVLRGERDEHAQLALRHMVSSLPKLGGDLYSLVNVLYTLSMARSVSRRIRDTVEGLLKKLVDRQLPNGSWNNDVELTCRAVRSIAGLNIPVFNDYAEKGLSWLRSVIGMGGLKPRLLGFSISTVNEVRVGEYRFELPMLVGGEELEDVAAALIVKASKEVLVVNVEEDLVVEAVAKVSRRGVPVKLLFSRGGEAYGRVGLRVMKTGVVGRVVVVDGSRVIVPLPLREGEELYLALESGEVAELVKEAVGAG